MEILESAWPKTAGAVLAGGRSTRMGRDKAEIALSGETLLARAWRLVAGLVAPAWVCCSQACPRAGYPCLLDEEEEEGPARGVAAALHAAQGHGARRVLILACDLPLLTRQLLVALLEAKGQPGSLATVYASAATGRAEMLVGVYAVAALPYLQAGLARGERSLFRLIPPERLQRVLYPPSAAPHFLNCNAAVDLVRLQELECGE
ncbi:MAG: molybdenum cofactor guanylyltransferase [Desulfovibrio sp.]|uniref:molybdenum cofactor guanylyltransferase n=1 Tax=Desulfovibrio sp. TaxID=885 RepID=UPI001A65CAFF|nr:molybdenum cofactor guanylyltransferase [Desulfovibrio sp.]MBD5417235.1 molybdenum cofactor guanylyltransferase [Desulfovibrio sp.]